MKKILAVLALVVFLGGMSAPAFAIDNSNSILIELADKDPKKEKKAEKKAEKTTEAKSDCTKTCEKTCDDKK
jgi:hypothetical protein